VPSDLVPAGRLASALSEVRLHHYARLSDRPQRVRSRSEEMKRSLSRRTIGAAHDIPHYSRGNGSQPSGTHSLHRGDGPTYRRHGARQREN